MLQSSPHMRGYLIPVPGRVIEDAEFPDQGIEFLVRH